ncbi:MAG: class I SAM-dependent methyltransferase [Ilumatobacteraceae bacterium]|jgi:ubiquinone/menaquinone biosynthesis C-methylase UbiE|nr:class I SAM-dependent methyltransferase [Ilumatobacteraceae bacterium]
MSRRSKLLPWRTAGQVSEQFASGDDVVRETGWVFNNETGEELTLAEFVATGDDEVPAYLEQFGLREPANAERTMLEIGSGIGRMTCAFTREFGSVVASDLDAGFLERCRETVAKFGVPERLRTVHVADGRSIDLPDDSVDLTFSYITLQHCDHDDALDLCAESVRVTVPAGRIALNFRGRSRSDWYVLPSGALMRAMFRVPGIGPALTRRRWSVRLAWQANRLTPDQVLAQIGPDLEHVTIWRHPEGRATAVGSHTETFDGINPAHWWLVATVTTRPATPEEPEGTHQ